MRRALWPASRTACARASQNAGPWQRPVDREGSSMCNGEASPSANFSWPPRAVPQRPRCASASEAMRDVETHRAPYPRSRWTRSGPRGSIPSSPPRRACGARTISTRDPFRGGCERVAPEMHGRGSGVIRMAREGELQAALSRDGVDNSERKAEVLKHRSLFDVEFQIADRSRSHAGGGKIRGVESIGVDGFAHPAIERSLSSRAFRPRMRGCR